MKNITYLVILIVVAVVLIAAWGKIFPGDSAPKDDSQNPLQQGAHELTKGAVVGTAGGILDGIGEILDDTIQGWGAMLGKLFGTESTPATPAWSGVSEGNPFLAGDTAPAAPLPYGNPPAGLAQAGSSVNYGGDLLLSALQPE